MQAIRGPAAENAQGELVITLTIAAADKAAFFAAFPNPGAVVTLAVGQTGAERLVATAMEAVNPSPLTGAQTQTLSLASFDSSAVMQAACSTETARFAYLLCRYPPFQGFVFERDPRETRDSEQQAREFLFAYCGISRWEDVEHASQRLALLAQEFQHWHTARRGKPAVLFE